MFIDPSSFLRFDSRGQVKRPEFLDPRGKAPVCAGLLCPQIWPSSEPDGLGHIATPLGLIHPAHAAAIGELVGRSAEDVLALARGQTELEGEAFADALVALNPAVEVWIVRRVPVSSPTSRRGRRDQGGEEPPDAIGFAYLGLFVLNARAERVRELSAPALIVSHARQRLQDAFEKLLAALDGRTETPWIETGPLSFAIPKLKEKTKGARPGPTKTKGGPPPTAGVAFVGRDGALASRGDVTTLVARPGDPPRHYPTPSLRVVGVSDEGRSAVLRHTRSGAHHLLDLESGAWLEAPRDGFPRGLVRQTPDAAFVIDLMGARARPVEIAGPRLGLAALSPDQRFAWVADAEAYGGVYDVCSGELVAWPVLRWLEPTETSDRADDLFRHAAAAFVRTAAGRFRFFTGRRIFDGDVERSLPPGVEMLHAAAFDGRGERLLLLTADAAHVLALDGKALTLVARYEV